MSTDFLAAASAYSAGDVIGGAQAVTDLRPGPQIITSVEFMVEHTAVLSGESTYRLHLYALTPPSALADNDAWDIPAGDRLAYRGSVDILTPVDEGATLYVRADGINVAVDVPPSGTLYAYLETIGAFTATAAIRRVTLHSKPSR